MWDVPGVAYCIATILSRNGRAAMSRRKTSEIQKPGASMPIQTSLFMEVTCGFLFFLMSHYSMSVCIFSCKDAINYRPMTAYFSTVSSSQCHSVVPSEPWKSDRDIRRAGFMNDHFHRKLKTHPFHIVPRQ